MAAKPTAQSTSLPSDTPNFITSTPDTTNDPIKEISTELLEKTPTPTHYSTPTPYPMLINPDTNESIPITWGSYPGPTLWPSLPIPPPMGLIPKPDNQINILLLGNDKRGPKSGTRTDTIISVSYTHLTLPTN